MTLTTISVNQETANYWEQLKGTSRQVKLSLISLLSASLVKEKVEAQVTNDSDKLHITTEDLEITPFVATLGRSIKPLPADFDYKKAKEEYLTQKYG